MNKDKIYYEQQAPYSEYLKWYQEQDLPKYEKPSMTNDSIIFAWDAQNIKLKFLAIKRKAHPFRGKYALPGGFMNIDETLENSVIREVKEETNLDITPDRIEQLKVFDEINRDPRMRIITVAHLVYMPNYEDLGFDSIDGLNATAGDDANEVNWLTIRLDKDENLVIKEGDNVLTENDFAFDHWDILSTGMKRVKNRLKWIPSILSILPEYFTATEARLLFSFFEPKLQNVPNSANFITTYGKFMNMTEVTLDKDKLGKGRPPRYYRMGEMDSLL